MNRCYAPNNDYQRRPHYIESTKYQGRTNSQILSTCHLQITPGDFYHHYPHIKAVEGLGTL